MNRQQRRSRAALARRTGSLEGRVQRHYDRARAAYDRLLARADDFDYIEELERENAILREKQARYERDILPLAEFARRTPKIEELQEEVARLRYQVEATARNRIDLRELPSDLVAVLDTIELFYCDRLVFAPEARRSAAETSFHDLHAAWRVLRAMATTLHDLYTNGARDIERAFREQTGLELALTEGSETRKNPQLRRHRTVELGGRQFDISAHVKFGSRPPRQLRVHYAVAHGVILVGHCGDHLPTAGTRRMS
jgi:hypothetical protein